jgi:4'-phosphopantetheinyl transferase EntD
MIESLLPAGIAATEVFSHGGDESALCPEELAFAARSVPKRRAEFAAGRTCARDALARLGVVPSPILPGAHREPVWPEGVVGSVTHCEGYAAAAVARGDEFATIGIDAEPDAPLPRDVTQMVTTAEERRFLSVARSLDVPSWDRLLFSAKEAVFKAWFGLTAQLIGFDAATLTFNPGKRGFRARLAVGGAPLVAGQPVTTLDGRWAARNGLVVTAIALPRADDRCT